MKKTNQNTTQAVQHLKSAVSEDKDSRPQIVENPSVQAGDMQEAVTVSDAPAPAGEAAEALFFELPQDDWLSPEALGADAVGAAGYAPVNAGSYPGVYEQVAAAQTLPQAAIVEAEEMITTSSALPYILLGSGLLLTGLTVAAGGSGKGSDNDEPDKDGEAVTVPGTGATQNAKPAEPAPVTVPVAEKTPSTGTQPEIEEQEAEQPQKGTTPPLPQTETKQTPPTVTEPKAEGPVAEKPAADAHQTDTAAGSGPEDGPSGSGTVTPAADTENETAASAAKQSGLTLDIAKHFYSADVIKKYIDVISAEGGTYLQLHLSDDENYAFESKVLNQLVSNATLNSDGTYTNNATGKQFLSFEQIADIAAYAKAKGVNLIPEVDTPNHMDAIFTLLELYQGKDYVNLIKSKVVQDEIDITSDDAIAFVQSLYNEVIDLMDGSSEHFHIGGDEFGYSTESNHEFISYANKMAAFLETHGLTTRMWNDGLLKTSLATLDKDIEITYWSYDGNPADSAAAAERRVDRASMDDLLDNGFDVLNYNWYYLYFVPDRNETSPESGAHLASDIQAKWELGLWDGTSTAKIEDTDNIIGASLTIWGEHAEGMTDDEIFDVSVQGLTALISKVNSLSVDTGTLSGYTLELTPETAFNQIFELDDRSANMVNVSMTDDVEQSGNAFVWLNGTGKDMIALNADWKTEGVSALKDNVSYTLYKHGQNHLYVDTDIAVVPVEI